VELVHVRVSVDRQSGEPGEPVLVEGDDDARLHAHARAALRDHDACVRSTPRDAKAEHALRPAQYRRDADAARRLRIAVARDERRP
jgi:hypothetical protein